MCETPRISARLPTAIVAGISTGPAASGRLAGAGLRGGGVGAGRRGAPAGRGPAGRLGPPARPLGAGDPRFAILAPFLGYLAVQATLFGVQPLLSLCYVLRAGLPQEGCPGLWRDGASQGVRQPSLLDCDLPAGQPPADVCPSPRDVPGGIDEDFTRRRSDQPFEIGLRPLCPARYAGAKRNVSGTKGLSCLAITLSGRSRPPRIHSEGLLGAPALGAGASGTATG